MAISLKNAEFLMRSRLQEAETGDVDALFELGVTYSTGRGGVPVDLVEAHKWFNLAALNGCTRGQQCRAEISARHSWPRSLPLRAARLNHLWASIRSTSSPWVPVE